MGEQKTSSEVLKDAKVDSDAEFLEWVASWLDRTDPIMQEVIRNSKTITEEERAKVIAWLEGDTVQQRLRTIARQV